MSRRSSNAWRRIAVRAGAATLAVGFATGLGGVASAAPVVTPFISCYWPNSDGSITAVVGYNNTSGTTQTYPVGPLNFVSPSPQDRGQPTVFAAGNHSNVWTPTISGTDLATGADWTLNGFHLSTNVGNVAQCATKPVPITGGAGGVIAFAAIAVAAGAVFFGRRRFSALAGFRRS